MFSFKIIGLTNKIVLTTQRNLTFFFFFFCVFLYGIQYFERRICKIAFLRLCFGVRLDIFNSRMQFSFLEYVMPSHVQLGPLFFFFSFFIILLSRINGSHVHAFTCHLRIDYTFYLYKSFQDRSHVILRQIIHVISFTCHSTIDHMTFFVTCHPKINYTYVVVYMPLLACLLTIDHMSFIHMLS